MKARDRGTQVRWRSAAAVGGAVVGVLAVASALVLVQARGGGARVDQPVQVSGLPAPDVGQRWVSWRGVAVLVPQAWDYGVEPDDQWCAYDGTGDDSGADAGRHPEPYVALDPTYGFHTDVGCPTTAHHDPAFGPAPESLWADHVTLESPQGPDGTWQEGDWTLTTRTVAGVQVKVLSRDSAQAGIILASARTTTVDAAGCPVVAPVQNLDHVRPDPFDVTSVGSVDAVSVCQYDRTVPGSEPGLMASDLITGSPAAAYLQAVQSAPVGGGPDDPADCDEHQTFGTGIVVRLWSGTSSHDLYAYYDSCRDNGVDDGIHRRALTRGDCAPLFAQRPVTLWEGHEDVFGICAPSRPQT